MSNTKFADLQAEVSALKPVSAMGRVRGVHGGKLFVSGLAAEARIGDQLQIWRSDGSILRGEVLQLEPERVVMLPDSAPYGVSLGDRVTLKEASAVAPSENWIGRIVDPFGKPMDGRPLLRGAQPRELRAMPPAPAERKAFGKRLETGLAALNTVLPVVEGQRVGLFAGSGVGKSSLLAHLAQHMEADVVVIAMIGERGRELRDFVENTLGESGMKRAVVVAATSDMSPLIRRRCAWTAMTVAEFFRDKGRHVLFLADSITRFAEAHREIATSAGELPTLRGYPPSTSHLIMSLCERAGPGSERAGTITALFSVLVAGSDLDEPISDILRGVLDGHIVLDRKIAERGRYPAIDLLRSVSRSLPAAASHEENMAILDARHLLGTYAKSEAMIQAGLYSDGRDPVLDQAIRAWPELDAFLASEESQDSQNSFSRLQLILRRAGVKQDKHRPVDQSR